ncbi:MAG: adenylate/guanylate cyclase domain-containing protein [Spirochaetota bacterium]
MKTRNRMSLRLSISGSIIVTVIATTLLIGGTTVWMSRQSMREDLSKRMIDVLSILRGQIDPELHATLHVRGDMSKPAYIGLRDRLLEMRKAVPDISYLYTFRMDSGQDKPYFVLDSGTQDDFSALGDVYDEATATMLESLAPPFKVRVESDFATDQWGTWLSGYIPIINAEGGIEAVLGMDMSASYISAHEQGLMLSILAIALVIAGAMVLFSVFIARAIARPLLALSDDMSHIAELKLDTVVKLRTGVKEVLLMVDALENMKKGLRSFRKYVPADLVTQLIGMQQEAVLGTKRQDLTIFFCDLAHFTTHTERLSPEDLNILMSAYFVAITEALQKEGATIDKFIGDAVMAFWNAPQALEDHALRALRASLAVQDAFAAAMAGLAKPGLPELVVRVGLATGEVMVGNMGHEGRLSYTAIGDAVNLASRLESLNKFYGTRILVAEETLRQAGNQIHFRPIDKVAVKGKDQGIVISEIAKAEPAWWADYRGAWEAYGEGDWTRAFEGFSRLADDPLIADGASKALSARCRDFLEGGVPELWNGTWAMQEK